MHCWFFFGKVQKFYSCCNFIDFFRFQSLLKAVRNFQDTLLNVLTPKWFTFTSSVFYHLINSIKGQDSGNGALLIEQEDVAATHLYITY